MGGAEALAAAAGDGVFHLAADKLLFSRCLHTQTIARPRHQSGSQNFIFGFQLDAPHATTGIYPIDIHHPGGTILRYLDGTEKLLDKSGSQRDGRWKPEGAPIASCYHIPYRSLVPKNSKNVLVAGRMLDADRDGFAGVRVMVNMNQTGEAAGTAAVIALDSNQSVSDIDPQKLRATLKSGGSIVL